MQAISEGEAVITASCADQTANSVVKVMANDEIVTGIHNVIPVSEDGTYVVYSANGILMMTTSDYNSLHKLPVGIYIINGKKTMIK